jgi:hypothetical protein
VNKRTPIRSVRLHDDGMIGTATRRIEREMGLPEGSVRLIYPNKRAARSDSTVAALKRRWGI